MTRVDVGRSLGRFADTVAVVTGGNSGIGLATAARLHAEGARVAISGRHQETLDAAAAGLGDGVIGVRADVTSLDDIDRLFATVAAGLGPVDVLVVNAGVGRYAPLETTSEELYDEMFDTNTKGSYFTLQKAVPHLNDGAAVVITAVAAVEPAWRRPGISAYATSKLALRSLTEIAAAELAGRQIRVNAVNPGTIRTPIFDRAGLPADPLDQRMGRIAAAVPLQRLGEADEVANVIAFLASPDASYVTGETVNVDGGMASR